MIKAIPEIQNPMLDEWVLNRFLTAKKPVESFSFILSSQGVLIISENLSRGRIKCTLLNGDSYQSTVTRTIKHTDTGEQLVMLQGHLYDIGKQQYYKASEYVRTHVAKRLQMLDKECSIVDASVKGKAALKRTNLERELLLKNLQQIT